MFFIRKLCAGCKFVDVYFALCNGCWASKAVWVMCFGAAAAACVHASNYRIHVFFVPKPTAVMDMRQSTAFVRMCESLCRHGGDMACKCTHVQSTFKHWDVIGPTRQFHSLQPLGSNSFVANLNKLLRHLHYVLYLLRQQIVNRVILCIALWGLGWPDDTEDKCRGTAASDSAAVMAQVPQRA